MRLLISVRDRVEARVALAGGADIIDAKDPSAGALGAVALTAFEAIVDVVGGRLPVTAAIGDDTDTTVIEARAFAFARAGAVFVKIGLPVHTASEAERMLVAARRGAVAGGAAVVAVAYADDDGSRALHPDAVVRAARAANVAGVLLDTARKDGGGLTDLVSSRSLRAWVERVHASGMFAAVGGQLAIGDFDVVRRSGADIAGVRGAACEGGRNGDVSLAKVQTLAAALRAPAPRTSSRQDQAAALVESTDRR